MRITLLFLFVTSLCCAQEITIYQSGKVTKTKVFGSTDNSFYAKEGTFKFTEIDSINTLSDELNKKFDSFRNQSPLESNAVIDRDKNNRVLVNDIDINTLDVEYVELIAYQQAFSMKYSVAVYYGQPIKLGEDQRIIGYDGKIQKFFGVIDALNFMHKRGWEFLNAYVVTSGNQNVYHYILKRIH